MYININHKKITIYSLFAEVGSSKCTLNKIVTVQYHKLMDYKCVCKMCSRADFSSCNPDFISAARAAAYLLAGWYPIFFYIVLLSTLDSIESTITRPCH